MTTDPTVPLHCPICTSSSPLQRSEPEAYRCPSCGRDFSVKHGIPDLRVWPDPYSDADDDWAKGIRVVREAGAGGFQSVLESYWRLTPETPSSFAARFIRYAMAGVARGERQLARVAAVRGRSLDRSDALLDLGCGTGGLVVAASLQVGRVVGVDIAARWLVVAGRRLEEAGTENATLVCACAERLPFFDSTFDIITAVDVLEHSQHQRQLMEEIGRVLRPDGVLLLTTPNRWSLLGEPHVGLWGVGFLPRRWMASYVWLVRRVAYRFIQLVSPVELEQLVHGAGLRIVENVLPHMSIAEQEGFTAGARRLIALHEVLGKIPGLKPLLLWFGPRLDIVVGHTMQADNVVSATPAEAPR